MSYNFKFMDAISGVALKKILAGSDKITKEA